MFYRRTIKPRDMFSITPPEMPVAVRVASQLSSAPYTNDAWQDAQPTSDWSFRGGLCADIQDYALDQIAMSGLASFLALGLNGLSISTALGSSGPIGLVVGTDEPFTE
jgi:hypothetical protein